MTHSASEWGASEHSRMLTFLQIGKVYCVALTWERLRIHVDFLTLCRRAGASAGMAPSRTRGAQTPRRASGTLSSATQGGRRSHMLTCTRTFQRLWNEPHSHVAAKESVTQPEPAAGPPFTDTHLFVCVEILKSGIKEPGCKFAFVPLCCPSARARCQLRESGYPPQQTTPRLKMDLLELSALLVLAR